MKHLLTSILLCICFVGWTQKGFKLIRKSEIKIEKGHYKSALRLLDRADKSGYGFCGLGYLAGKEAIAINRAKIYDELGESRRAGDEINSIVFPLQYNGFDSLKTVYYIHGCGKESIKQEIDSCIDSIQRSILDSIQIVGEISLNTNFSEEPFLISHQTLNKIVQETRASMKKHPEGDYMELFKAAIRHQPFYQLLE